MRVLVTGHEGCLGCVVVPRVRAARHEVVGLDIGFFTERGQRRDPTEGEWGHSAPAQKAAE